MNIIDTHCHVHDPEFTNKYDKSVETILSEAKAAGVSQYILVGTSGKSSILAVDFAEKHGAYAALALHPHEPSLKPPAVIDQEFVILQHLLSQGSKRIVAIGECGLDYFYHHTPQEHQAQKDLFKRQLDLGLRYNLPFIFHVRDAFSDFFEILDEYSSRGIKIRGVVHSFSAHSEQLQYCLDRGLYIGLNGIMTFTKDAAQLEAAKAVPKDKMLLETDAPFLTPKPFRGTMCELKYVVETAKFLSQLRGETLPELAEYTTQNAKELFGI